LPGIIALPARQRKAVQEGPRRSKNVDDKTGTRASTDRTRLRRRRPGAADDALAVASAQRAKAVGQNAGSLCPRCPPVSGISLRTLGRGGDAGAIRRARGQRRQGLHGDAARPRYWQPFPDAGACRLALVRTLPRAGRQGQGRRLVGDPRPQGRQDPAEADPDDRRQAFHRRHRARRRDPRSLDLGARRRCHGAVVRLGPAYLRGAMS